MLVYRRSSTGPGETGVGEMEVPRPARGHLGTLLLTHQPYLALETLGSFLPLPWVCKTRLIQGIELRVSFES